MVQRHVDTWRRVTWPQGILQRRIAFFGEGAEFVQRLADGRLLFLRYGTEIVDQGL